ncbi:MAG: RpiB/LacA/LacB family sugar-phosphate isomerase, partial [Clostridia bacterium]|nr:RpiB/LacA/LacB family sugar-phosphate isomerase [Clostridia bacterium]
VRASLCTEESWTMLARRDDLANVLVIPSGIVGKEKAIELIKVFLNTPYGEGKYQRRADMIDDPNY